MADFRQMGGIPEGYDQLLSSARQQLVKMPDGSYRVAPQFGAGTSLNEIYGGILPSSQQNALTSRSVNTVPIDVMTGQPLFGFTPPTMADTRAEQSGSRPAITQGVQPAGTTQMPLGVVPQSVQQAFAQMGVQPSGPQGRGQPVLSAQGGGVWDPFNPNTQKDQTRLPTNAGEQAFMQAFYPQQGNAATAAIDQATGGAPMPRPRPDLAMPFTPSPNLRGGSPQGQPGAITFKRGDTVSQLARDRGMTTQQFAKMYGIADPNRIIAGKTVSPVGMAGAPPARVTTGTPSRTSLVSTLKSKPTERRQSIYVDQFGMVI